jgi:hypothetical protein
MSMLRENTNQAEWKISKETFIGEDLRQAAARSALQRTIVHSFFQGIKKRYANKLIISNFLKNQ